MIGVFGGSGFYSFLEDEHEVVVDTPYGPTSSPVHTGEIGGCQVAFIPRHGMRHEFPAHAVPYQANVWAMKALGVERILGPCAVGSLQRHIKPGDFVVCDQLVDRTRSRPHTFHHGPQTTHISFADPYCEVIRSVIISHGADNGLTTHDRGTVVVIEGPRFSTRAESKWFSAQGWDVVNMTQYPEALLAREMEMCYANISLVTDWDVGVGDVPPVTHDEVMQVVGANNTHLRDLLLSVIPELPVERSCECATALENARYDL